MAPNPPRLKILSVGGNAVSAFLSWRLQATNACDVTLVWKSGYEAVHQYGISFRSTSFGNERFKPRNVVRIPEDAAKSRDGAFDYVLLCVKALPDVYDLAGVIESVVTPQHTCILVNTTHTLGIEAHIERRFPTNVVLSLVSGAELGQIGISEFEHKGSTEVWVGPANKNSSIPASIQQDMAEALAMTLSTGQVDCRVSNNILQQQYERMIGPIAFFPASVMFETPVLATLIDKTGARDMMIGIVDELMLLAQAQGCSFPPDFKETTIEEMLKPTDAPNGMYQDFTARRPMEVETYLGSPIKLAKSVGLAVPRIETMYALLHHMNTANQNRPKADTTGTAGQAGSAIRGPPIGPGTRGPPPISSANGNGMGRGRARTSSFGGPPPPPAGRRQPPPGAPNGYGPSHTNGHPPRRAALSRRESDNELGDEFSHVVLYDDIPEGASAYGVDGGAVAFREKELALKQRELALREQELRMKERSHQGPRRRGAPPPSVRNGGYDDDDDEDGEDYFDPNAAPLTPMIDPDNFDMMSVTSRRARKHPINQRDVRRNPEPEMQLHSRGGRGGLMPGRGGYSRNRSSQNIMTMPMDDPMAQFSDNRYGNVDRTTLGIESRTNSLTAARLDTIQQYGGPQGPQGLQGPQGAMPRRTSQSPGNPYAPAMGRVPNGMSNGRPSPPNGSGNGYGPRVPAGGPVGGRRSPPNGMRQPVPRYPPGQGNAVAPQQVEQHAGVSALHPPKANSNVRSLTGSASASLGSGESAHLDSAHNSAHSSQSSLGPRPPIGAQ